ISKRLKSVTPAKADVQKRTENTGFQLSPELQQQTFEIGSGAMITLMTVLCTSIFFALGIRKRKLF
ncbi:MAG: hypothetical protein C0403_19405, partial [Desulfobacterium sp.]|nr:hypothetical protein [Desulfobacterium sp.]